MGADYTQMCRAWQSSWHTFAQNQSQLVLFVYRQANH